MEATSMSVKMRQEVERKIATAFVTSAIQDGYGMTVDYGDGSSEKFVSIKATLTAMFQGDDDMLVLYKQDKSVAWIHFVYGNDGWDVISDYSVNLEPIMTAAKKISAHYED